jgi:threonine/homoserine/homoserine lactone efflux protein
MPVEFATLAAFSLTALAIVVTPGPDTILILRYAFISGQRSALAAVAGIQIGLTVHTVLAGAGLSVVIATSPVLLSAVTVAGALYLGWLGVQGLRGRRPLVTDDRRLSAGPARACRDAIVTNILNPKVILLFVALYPNFLEVDRGAVPLQLGILSLVLILINVAWQAPLAWSAARLGRWLERPNVQRTVGAVSGAVLVACAGLMLIEHLA